jgi:hypothetical protein
MFVCEIEEEYVIRLPVNAFFDRVGLVGYEGCEDSVVAHSGYDVIPVGFTKVEVGFFSKEEGGFEFSGC